MRRFVGSLPRILHSLVIALTLTCAFASPGQEAKPPAKPSTPAAIEKNPAQIELLETKNRFETNGDSRKEVHIRVKINNELGVRQFSRLNFDFNRSFQSVEIPLVRITHASGGVADILPSAITDNPNPAVVDFPAYHDVRVKSVRILGLQPDDLLEYRIVTTTTHHPLAPDFWLDHTFDRSGVVTEEAFDLDLPKVATLAIRINPATPQSSLENSGEGPQERAVYRWRRHTTAADQNRESNANEPDITLTTFASWKVLAFRLSGRLATQSVQPEKKEIELVHGASHRKTPAESIYYFVTQQIRTVELPLGATGYALRSPNETLAAGYGTREDKFVLFNSLFRLTNEHFLPVFVCSSPQPENQLPRPSLFESLLVRTGKPDAVYSDLGLEVAPFGAIPSKLRGSRGLQVLELFGQDEDQWTTVPAAMPFASSQRVAVQARLDALGSLAAKASYFLRGDNELLLRVAFHKTPQDKWKEIAQLLAISDGFRGEIKNVTASDPYTSEKPFEVEYEIEQPKFVDWSKKTVRIPALLPSPSLPDATTTASASDADRAVKKKIIDLGTPLDIELTSTVQLPPGTTALAPTGTSVERDYATFSSKYSVSKPDSPAAATTITATRKLRFLLKEIPAERAPDFNAFLHAVQSDQLQLFTLQPAAKTKGAS